MRPISDIRYPLTIGERVLVLEQLSETLGELTSDHEKRLRWIERIVLYGLGIVGLGSFVLNFYFHKG